MAHRLRVWSGSYPLPSAGLLQVGPACSCSPPPPTTPECKCAACPCSLWCSFLQLPPHTALNHNPLPCDPSAAVRVVRWACCPLAQSLEALTLTRRACGALACRPPPGHSRWATDLCARSIMLRGVTSFALFAPAAFSCLRQTGAHPLLGGARSFVLSPAPSMPAHVVT